MIQSRLLLALAATATLAACTDPQNRPENIQSPLVRPPMLETRPASFDCDDSGRVIVRPLGEDGKTITLAFKSRELQLKKVDAAEGQKYSDGATVFWMNGDNANLLVKGKESPESCERP
ncbi:MAG: MliC family protein [Alphaproteobacteria bacterium]|nr:MliC family protein [Alphaproteobacteria bacterium]